MMMNRLHGYYRICYWALIAINVGFVNVLWFKKVRKSPVMLFFVSVDRLVAMWLERFVIVVHQSAARFPALQSGAFTFRRVGTGRPSSERSGSSSLAFPLFIRVLPMISIFEMRDLLPAAKPKHALEVAE